MTDKLYTYDSAETLDGPEAIAVFMADAFETGDASYIAKAIGVVAKARGMADLARDTGLARQQLYKSLSEDGNPTLKTMLAVTSALGLKIVVKPAAVCMKETPH